MFINNIMKNKTIFYKIIIFCIIISLNVLNVQADNLIKKTTSTPHKNKTNTQKILKFPAYIFSYNPFISYFVASGYMGDVGTIQMWKITDVYSYKQCLKLTYEPKLNKSKLGWIGMAWQWPANNWGNNPKGGYDLSAAKSMFFFAKGDKGDELIEFKVGGTKGLYGDTEEISTGVIKLNKNWTLYKIDLKDKNLKNIITGFSIILVQNLNINGATFYLDEVYFTDKEAPDNSKLFEYGLPLAK